MKKVFTLLVLFSGGFAAAQNLVPNGDFEHYNDCPDNLGIVDKAIPWFNPNASSPEYFNSCTQESSCGVPSNTFGYQQAHSGHGYAGLGLYVASSPFREYIETPLNSPMMKDSVYRVEFYFCLAEISHLVTPCIGVALPDHKVTSSSEYLMTPLTAQLSNPRNNVPDTLNWRLFSGTYKARGGERFLIIGNFETDANTPTTTVPSSSTLADVYVYIDDVTVRLASQDYPQVVTIKGPCYGDQLLPCPDGTVKMEIYNAGEELVKGMENPSGNAFQFLCNDLPQGHYVVRFIKRGGAYTSADLFLDN